MQKQSKSFHLGILETQIAVIYVTVGAYRVYGFVFVAVTVYSSDLSPTDIYRHLVHPWFSMISLQLTGLTATVTFLRQMIL